MSARDLSVVAALWVVNGKGYRIAAEKDREALMRLAELGAKCLQAIRRNGWDVSTLEVDSEDTDGGFVLDTVRAARDLGLLKDDDEGGKA